MDITFYRKVAEHRIAEHFADISHPWLSEGKGRGVVKFVRYNGGPIPERKPSAEELRWRKLLVELPEEKFFDLCGKVWDDDSE